MNVTKTGAKCSQLPADVSGMEGSLQKNSAEHEGYAGVYNLGRITENNITDVDVSKERLLEKIVDRTNMNNAFKRVKSNKGAHGVDGMEVDELLQYLKENGDQLRQSILDGKYRPNPVNNPSAHTDIREAVFRQQLRVSTWAERSQCNQEMPR